MNRITTETRSMSEFQARLHAIMDQVRQTQRPLRIDESGKKSVVVLDAALYDQLIERLEILEAIRAADEDIINGRVVSQEEARQQVLRQLDR
ncbi:MAG: type II toxin-antitoxin system Phd/YefM family antitoxin [Chlorobi bacterium]|nr:type II toxin-antitoxin system Phd/YefM family antitoxin [Chlorobiota bacterium]